MDANIIIRDSFRVAQGKMPSTERIFSSPYIELLAPKIILEEVEQQIRKDLPKNASLEKALAHARELHSKIKIVEDIPEQALQDALRSIGKHDPDDTPYLGLAIASEAEGIVSGDKKAFDKQTEVKRWDLRDFCVLCETYESGALSFFVVGKTTEIIGKAFEWLLIEFLETLKWTLEIIKNLFVAVIEKSMEAFSKIPDWAWPIIISVLVVGVTLLVCQEGFWNLVYTIVKNVIEIGKIFWNALKSLFIWLWELVWPVVEEILIIAGTLCRMVWLLLTQEMKRKDLAT